MFTGLVQEVGIILCLEIQEASCFLRVEAPQTAAASQVGQSISINGCCLTITQLVGSQMSFHLLQETLRCTNLGALQSGSLVNCEPSLAAHSRLGGHFVQGHVDTIGRVLSFNFFGEEACLEVSIPNGFEQYLIFKGSIAVNGVSLTVADLKQHSFMIWLIPHTLECTNLRALKIGNTVNLEFDVLAKYVERLSSLNRTGLLSSPHT